MTRTLPILVLAVVSVLGSLGCEDSMSAPSTSNCALEWKDEGLCLNTEWVELPSADKKGGQLRVQFWRPKTGGTAEGPYVSPTSEWAVTLFMPEHGHGSDVDPEAKEEAPGVFLVKPIHFIMRGKWEIRIGGATLVYKY